MVKFGHHLVSATEEHLKQPELQQPIEYKQLKKLMQLAKTTAASENIAEVARNHLDSPFWNWAQDAAGIDTKSEVAWTMEVFERKLRSEIRRVERIAAIAAGASSHQHREAARLRGLVRKQESSEEDVRRLMGLEAGERSLRREVDTFTDLNYTACFKIMKKFDKNLTPVSEHPERSLLRRLMPVVDETMYQNAAAAEDGAGAPPAPVRGQERDANLLQGVFEIIGGRHRTQQESMSKICSQAAELVSEVKRQRIQEEADEQDGEKGEPVETDGGLLGACASRLTPPLAQVLRSGYGAASFKADLSAAVVIAVAGIPKAMAYASLAGLPVDYGIATLYVPCLVYALLGWSRQVAISPQSVTCLLLAQMVDDALAGGALEGDLSERVRLTMMYTFWTGAVIMAFGALNLGRLLDFLSRPVLSGFVSASAIIAAAATAKSLLAIKVVKSPILYVLIGRICSKLKDVHWPTATISVVGIIVLFVLPKLQKKAASALQARAWPRPWLLAVATPPVLFFVLLGVLLGGGLCGWQSMKEGDMPYCADVKMVGYIKTALPSFDPSLIVPETKLSMGGMLVNAMLLAAVALLEHVANAKLYADRNGYAISMSLDLVALGVSNMAGAVSGSFISAGGFSRSALNAGAVSQMSLLMSVFVSLGFVYVAAPALSMMPDPVLNVILFVAVVSLIDWKIIRELARLRKRGVSDFLALSVAFLATAFLGVIQGIFIAMAFSLFVFILRTSRLRIVEMRRQPGEMQYEGVVPQHRQCTCAPLCLEEGRSAKPPAAMRIFRINAPLWFANASRLGEQIQADVKRERLKGLVLDMSAVSSIDLTAATALKNLVTSVDRSTLVIVFAGTLEDVRCVIQETAQLDDSHFFESCYSAEMHVGEVLAGWAEGPGTECP